MTCLLQRMFGYTVPFYGRLSPSCLAAYRKYYCETCHQLKAYSGLVSTVTVNYDMTFNTIVMNSLAGDVRELDATAASPLCVLKRPGTGSELFRRMAAYTMLLTKWELVDDDVDKPSLKGKVAGIALGRSISKAEDEFPEYDEAVGNGFRELRRMEEDGCSDPVHMGDVFGKALASPLRDIAGTDDKDVERMFAGLTAAIYVMDAVDDLDDDYMDGTYNPFLAGGERFVNKETFIDDNVYMITETMNKAIGNLQGAYSKVRRNMELDRDLTDNIVYFGIPNSARNVMSCSCRSGPSLRNACDSRINRNARG